MVELCKMSITRRAFFNFFSYITLCRDICFTFHFPLKAVCMSETPWHFTIHSNQLYSLKSKASRWSKHWYDLDKGTMSNDKEILKKVIWYLYLIYHNLRILQCKMGRKFMLCITYKSYIVRTKSTLIVI